MVRLLFWIALIVVAIWYYKRWKQRAAAKSRPQPPASEASPMVRCAHCGVHLPRDRALSEGEQWYCSPDHRLQGPTAGDR